jgi:membrane protein
MVRLGWRAYRIWDRNDCLDLSAAFAYHSLQSLFPILLIALGLSSRILGSGEGLTERILEFADRFLPASADPIVQLTLLKLYRQGTGAGFIGLVFLLLTASNAYLTLQRGTDRLWGLRSSEP